MKRLLIASGIFLAFVGSANAETVIIKCVDPTSPQTFHKTFEWNKDEKTGIDVERDLYVAFRESPSSIIIEYLSGPEVGVSFRLDRSDQKLYVNGNNSGLAVAQCTKVEPKI
jgi:hypothetical protein